MTKPLADLVLDMMRVFGEELSHRPDRHYLEVMYGEIGKIIHEMLEHEDIETRDYRYVPSASEIELGTYHPPFTDEELANAAVPGFSYNPVTDDYDHESIGPVVNPDGSPTTVTLAMLTGKMSPEHRREHEARRPKKPVPDYHKVGRAAVDDHNRTRWFQGLDPYPITAYTIGLVERMYAEKLRLTEMGLDESHVEAIMADPRYRFPDGAPTVQLDDSDELTKQPAWER